MGDTREHDNNNIITIIIFNGSSATGRPWSPAGRAGRRRFQIYRTLRPPPSPSRSPVMRVGRPDYRYYGSATAAAAAADHGGRVVPVSFARPPTRPPASRYGMKRRVRRGRARSCTVRRRRRTAAASAYESVYIHECMMMRRRLSFDSVHSVRCYF